MSTATAPAEPAAKTDVPVLTSIGLRKYYPVKEGAFQRVVGHVRAVDGVSFEVRQGETLGIVGESGCGKTTLGRCLTALIKPTHGGVYFELPAEERATVEQILAAEPDRLSADEKAELTAVDRRYRVDLLTGAARRSYRRNCQMVFQDAFSSLNPRHLVRDIVGRPLRIHKLAQGREVNDRVVSLLEAVGLGSQHLNRYPHEFSGGQQQRISIARALALDPQVIVLDEPTSALDVSVQAQILNLLHELQQKFGLTYVFVSHDLGVIQHVSDRILVMYLGEIAEDGPTAEVFATPKHPYTGALVDANPALQEDISREMKGLAGAVPDPAKPPQGCRFHTRCPVATPVCGWDLEDAVGWLMNRPDLADGFRSVDRRTPFEGAITLVDDESATRVEQALRRETPEPMQAALLGTERSGASVSVRFRERERVPLEEVLPGRRTNCVLETESRAPHTGSPRQ